MADVEHSGGWIKLHRCAMDHPVFSEAVPWQVFTMCLMRASHAKKVWHGIPIDRGELITSIALGCELCNMAPNTWRRTLQRLVELELIAVETDSMRYTKIRVLNYDKWQGGQSTTSSKFDKASDEVNTTNRGTLSKSDKATDKVTDKATDEATDNIQEGLRTKESKEEGTVSPATPSPQPPTPAETKKAARKAKEAAFVPPTRAEAHEFAKGCPFTFSVDQWYDYYAARGWTMARGVKMTNWRAAMQYWAREDKRRNPNAWQSQFKLMSEIPGQKPQ